jgi:hypothetical protein
MSQIEDEWEGRACVCRISNFAYRPNELLPDLGFAFDALAATWYSRRRQSKYQVKHTVRRTQKYHPKEQVCQESPRFNDFGTAFALLLSA